MGILGRSVSLCLEDPFFPHSWVGSYGKDPQNRSRVTRGPSQPSPLALSQVCGLTSLAGRKAHLAKHRAREVQGLSPALDPGMLQPPCLCSFPCQKPELEMGLSLAGLGVPQALACLLASSPTQGTHSTMGVMVKNFRDAVNWTP